MTPCSSSIDTGIIPSPDPSPHWLASRLGFSLRLGPWHHGYYFSWCGCLFSGRLACSWNGLSWLFGTLARRCKWAEYITFLLSQLTTVLKPQKSIYTTQHPQYDQNWFSNGLFLVGEYCRWRKCHFKKLASVHSENLFTIAQQTYFQIFDENCSKNVSFDSCHYSLVYMYSYICKKYIFFLLNPGQFKLFSFLFLKIIYIYSYIFYVFYIIF